MGRDGTRGLMALGLAVLLGLGAPGFALDANRRVTQYSHDSWQDDDGLPQNSVFALAQTGDGYLWLGTWEGVVRFDGVHFTVFDKRNTPELRDPMIRALAEDAAGVLWVGTAGGLLSFREGRFQRMPPEAELAEVQVNVLAPASDGGMWVGTAGGLFHLREGRARRFIVGQGLPDDEVLSLGVDPKGPLYVGTRQGLARLSGERLVAVPLPVDAAVRALHVGRDGSLWVGTGAGLLHLREGRSRHFTTRDGLPHDLVQSLLEDRDGNLWVGTEWGGLTRWTGEAFHSFGPQAGFSGERVMSLLEDRDGNLWAGTVTGGLNRLRDSAFVPFGVPEGFASDAASVVLEDRHGALWVGTSGGLHRMKDGVLTRFGAAQGLTQDIIRALAEGKDGMLWVGTSGGAFRFDGQRFTHLGREEGLAHEMLHSLLVDSRGDVWFGTSAGLSRLRDGTLTTFGAAHGVPETAIVASAEDNAGALWFGSHSGLVRLAGGTFTRFTSADGLAGDVVLDIHADARGGLWVGTKAGLTLVRGGRLTRFTTSQGLFDDAVFRVLEDEEEQLWMSCNKGVSRVSRRELEEVAEGRRAAVQPTVFDRRDGMRSAECNGGSQPAGWRGRDGKLWFPTIRGLVRVDPSHAQATWASAEVRLEEVRVHGQPIPFSRQRLVLQPGQMDVEFRFTALALTDSTRRPLRFRLEGYDRDWVDAEGRRTATYTHLPPGDYRFRVSAANRDGVWTEPGEVLELSLTPLFHQTVWFYSLCIVGAVLLGVGVYGLRVGRLKARERWLEARVEERTRELAEANRGLDENLRALREAQAQLVHAGKMAAVGTLAAGVGHEINNPLAYIVSNLEFTSYEAAALARQMPPGAERLGERLQDMDRALREALHGADRVRRIVADLRTLSRGDEEARGPVDLHAVLDSAAKMAGNELSPRARLVKDYGEVPWVDGNEPRLVQVFLNLLINAAQALPEGKAAENEVCLVTRREGLEWVRVEVRDTGCGIPPEVLGRIFDPFFTTKPVGVGTGLGLALCHTFVTSMGGSIAVESGPGRGTVMRVLLRAAASEPIRVVPERLRPMEEAAAYVRGQLLIVDDDPMVSASLRRTLGRDHDVEVVLSARAALSLLLSPARAEVDILLCDLMMPEMTGMDLYAELCASSPALARRMVFITGGAFTPAARDFLARVDNPRVEKPFDPERLREQVRGWVAQVHAERGRPSQAS